MRHGAHEVDGIAEAARRPVGAKRLAQPPAAWRTRCGGEYRRDGWTAISTLCWVSVDMVSTLVSKGSRSLSASALGTDSGTADVMERRMSVQGVSSSQWW